MRLNFKDHFTHLRKHGQQGDRARVRTHTLDSVQQAFAPSARSVIAIIDVEGFEQETLLGMSRMIKTGAVKFAHIEVWSVLEGGQERKRFRGLELLLQSGYHLCLERKEVYSAQPATIRRLMEPICARDPGLHTKGAKSKCLTDMGAWHGSVFKGC